jgi:hypothetical protein
VGLGIGDSVAVTVIVGSFSGFDVGVTERSGSASIAVGEGDGTGVGVSLGVGVAVGRAVGTMGSGVGVLTGALVAVAEGVTSTCSVGVEVKVEVGVTPIRPRGSAVEVSHPTNIKPTPINTAPQPRY